MRRRRGLLDHGGVLLSHLVHLVEGRIDLVQAGRLFLRRGRDFRHQGRIWISLTARRRRRRFRWPGRRPVSVSALARSLGIPVETTRRHVVKLAQTGFEQRTEAGGVIVTSEILQREEIRQAALLNLATMESLIDGLVRMPRNR